MLGADLSIPGGRLRERLLVLRTAGQQAHHGVDDTPLIWRDDHRRAAEPSLLGGFTLPSTSELSPTDQLWSDEDAAAFRCPKDG